jgi:hypothetical protein
MKRIYSKAAVHRLPDLRRLLDANVFDPMSRGPGKIPRITPGGDDQPDEAR